MNRLLALFFFLPLLSILGQTGVFDFDKKTITNSTTSVTQSVGGLKLTVSSDQGITLGTFGSSTGNSVYVTTPTTNTSMTLTFTKKGSPSAVNISTIYAFEMNSNTATCIFTTDTGLEVTRTVSSSPVSLYFGNIKSITITASADVIIGIDDVTMDAAVPVELTSFAASAYKNGVKLNWQTATEVNNYGFSIERKSGIDNREWDEINFVEGHGNSNSPKQYSYYDTSPLKGKAVYRLKQIDTDGAFEYSDEVTVISTNLAKNELHQNHPNPFNPSTVISFTLAELAHVNITVYNAIGQKVMELANEQMDAGFHNVNFDGSGLSTGFYFYRLETPNYSKTMKMILLR